MSTKIQINSLEALERLIGNDNELEIELRNSIVQNFTKTYLKDLAKNELIEEARKIIVSELKKEFFEEMSNRTNLFRIEDIGFKSEVVENLRNMLRNRAKLELREVVSEVLKENKSYEVVKERLDQASSWILDELSKENLEKRLDQMVNAKLKTKLGID